LGDRRANIERAIDALTATDEVRLVRRSRFYQTSPVDYLHQPDFLNNVVEIETALDPESLWQRLAGIQRAVNPRRDNPKGPRVIDLDILLFGNLVVDESHLTIPHRSICKRRFVLIPLLELEPGLTSPLDDRSYGACLAELDDKTQRVELYHE
jgi:2-amino-4-hydroxy-6-hydroxymethyldihydropteridine diphosphokinase